MKYLASPARKQLRPTLTVFALTPLVLALAAVALVAAVGVPQISIQVCIQATCRSAVSGLDYRGSTNGRRPDGRPGSVSTIRVV